MESNLRTYEKSHPWLTFELDLNKAAPKLWMALGEAQSKCEHVAGVPLRPSTAKDLHLLYLAKGVAATTAIEGNTLSEEEVLNRIKGELELPGSMKYLGQEVDNIVNACNKIADHQIDGGSDELSVDIIKEYDRMVLDDLSLPEGVVPGEIRTYSVGVASYRCAPAEDCEFLLKRLCEWLNSDVFKAPEEDLLTIYGLIKAVVSHLYLAWIHPFGDGNGRTARLVEFQMLVASGVPLPAAHLLSNHYNQTRQEYYRQLDRTSKSGGEILPFIDYAIQGFLDGIRIQLSIIREQQFDVAWRNYVHESFKEMNRPSDVRCRHLILDLSESDETPVPISKLRMISPRVAESYAGKTIKAERRDVKKLLSMNLVEVSPEGVRPKREVISAFLPRRRDDVSG